MEMFFSLLKLQLPSNEKIDKFYLEKECTFEIILRVWWYSISASSSKLRNKGMSQCQIYKYKIYDKVIVKNSFLAMDSLWW